MSKSKKEPELLTDFPQYIRERLHKEYGNLTLPDFMALIKKLKEQVDTQVSYKAFVESMNVLPTALFERRFGIDIDSQEALSIVYFEGGPHIEVQVDNEKQRPEYWMFIERSHYSSSDLWMMVYRLYIYLAEHYYGMDTESVIYNIRYMIAKETGVELSQVKHPSNYLHISFPNRQHKRVQYLLDEWYIKINERTDHA